MSGSVVFAITLLVTLGVFSWSMYRLAGFFRLTKKGFPVRNLGKRFGVMLNVAFGQTKIFRRPVIGLFHAMTFWGFCIILFGSIEMVIDGLTGAEHSLHGLGWFYNFVVASGDIFALIVAIAILLFLVRRIFLHIRRFEGIEMTKVTHIDADIALSLILLLMLSLLGMNMSYSGKDGVYPVSSVMSGLLSGMSPDALHMMYVTCWWAHILLIFFFANYLPYSKHFHVFMSVPNVFLSRLEPLGKMNNMEAITREVRLMMYPAEAATPPDPQAPPERFGVKDAEDATWKNYFDSLSCTQCGRCTSVCPANITGKKLSPRKIVMDLRARMKEKGPLMVQNGRTFSDGKSLVRNYITEEELWACTLCNACAKECPININQPVIIAEMRRFLVMEEGSAPGGLKLMFSNMENNGAPWQYSPEDRLLWAENLEMKLPVVADLATQGRTPEYLFWVGCAGAYDDRYKKVAAAFAKILTFLNTDYAVLGKEESCTGDPARRAGNEMLYQMQAMRNIEVLNGYQIKKILTICPHCFNIFKNEYPDLGGNYEVLHYTQFLADHLKKGTLNLDADVFAQSRITYHDPCYLGRANDIYEEPRAILHHLTGSLAEMPRHKSFALCCGAGGAQMFKEAEPGTKEVFIERTEEALGTGASVIATACPFCMTMLTDGIKYKNRESDTRNLDIAELVVQSLNL